MKIEAFQKYVVDGQLDRAFSSGVVQAEREAVARGLRSTTLSVPTIFKPVLPTDAKDAPAVPQRQVAFSR